MEKKKKQGFFSTLKEEVIRGLSPARSRARSQSRSPSPAMAAAATPLPPPPRGMRGAHLRNHPLGYLPEQLITRSGSLRPIGEALAPLMEGPGTCAVADDIVAGEERRREGWGNWVRGQLYRAPSVSSSCGKSDLRLLLGVMGAPLAPVHVSSGDHLARLCIKDTPIETSSAHYILQQYMASTGGLKLQSSIRNAYVMGKVTMIASEFETATKVVKSRKSLSRNVESGGFVLWQMNPDMWYVELAVGGSKVHAGSNGELVWRHTPWLGAHAAKGPSRPLRRALQGIDPLTTASMFANSKCIGEKKVNGEDCFILKLSADPQTLKSRSEGPAEIIRHVLFGYFNQRTGLLVQIEDSHLTRIQSNSGGDAVYWETTISSFLDNYLPIDGVMIAHSGHSVVTLFRFGEMAMSHTKTRMEEVWTIEEVAFNVPGLSMDCFIPPADVRHGPAAESCKTPHGIKARTSTMIHRAKVAAVGKAQDDRCDKIIWRVEV
ncbi:uncharacterized protein [Typha angustifolia]|uniref:uncharacterized protein n=1 Tax=Typha angustifolia TaxID=59011 RepID=UPI003C2DA1F4